MKKKVSLGIDLGTTNTIITAKVKNESPITIVTATGSRLIPSIVHYGKNEITAGELAEIKLSIDPINTFYSTKRIIGRDSNTFDDDLYEKFPFIVEPGGDNNIYLKCPNQENRKVLPQEVASEILLEAYELFNKNFEKRNYDLSEVVVITIPAYFDSNQREATMDAALLAGMHNVELINEPTAAAIAYTKSIDKESNTIVFDLGGGTFDISLVNYDPSVFWDVVGSDGDSMLGGDDFDTTIANLIKEKCKKLKAKITFLKDSEILIRKYAKEFKEKLSSQISHEIICYGIVNSNGSSLSPNLKITRAEFDKASKPLYLKIEDKIKNFLSLDKIKNRNIDNVVLVGGSSRIPKFKTIVEKLTKLKVSGNAEINPDEAVSVGASIYSEFIREGKVRVSDVTPLDIGFEIKDDVQSVVVPRNSKIPLRKKEKYTTIEDFQDMVNMPIRQGNRPIASQNPLLGELNLEGISLKPKGKVKLEGTIMIDKNGILRGEAKDLENSAFNYIEIKKYMKLSKEQITELREIALKFKNDDKKLIYRINLKNQIENYYENSKNYLRTTDLTNKEELIGELEELYNLSLTKDKSFIELEKYMDSMQFICSEKKSFKKTLNKKNLKENEVAKNQNSKRKKNSSKNQDLYIEDPFS